MNSQTFVRVIPVPHWLNFYSSVRLIASRILLKIYLLIEQSLIDEHCCISYLRNVEILD